MYFVSFVLIGGFVILNIVIAVVLNSVEEARAEKDRLGEDGAQEAGRAEGAPVAGGGTNGGGPEDTRRRIAEIRAALDALEDGLRADPPARPPS